MQQMASRPFATINVALETDEEPPDLIGGNVKVSATFSQSKPPPNPRELPVVWADRKNDDAASIIGVVAHPPSSGELKSLGPSTAVCDYSHATFLTPSVLRHS